MSSEAVDQIMRALSPMLAELIEKAQHPDQPGWFSQRAGARYAGIHEGTFIRLRARGVIKAYFLPGLADARFKREELDRLFRPNRTTGRRDAELVTTEGPR